MLTPLAVPECRLACVPQRVLRLLALLLALVSWATPGLAWQSLSELPSTPPMDNEPGLDLGMNVNFVRDFSPAFAFTNALKRSRSWRVQDNGGGGMVYPPHEEMGGIRVPIHEQGAAIHYPDFDDPVMQVSNRVVLATIFNNISTGIPEGRYRLRWESIGDAICELRGDVQLIDDQSSIGLRDYMTTKDPKTIELIIRPGSQPSDTCYNIRVWTPTEANSNVPYDDGSPILRRDYLDKLREMFPHDERPVIRFLDWSVVNNVSGFGKTLPYEHREWYVTNWNGRMRVGYPRWNEDPELRRREVPVEAMVELCNRLGGDMWLNLPHQEEDPAAPGSLAYNNYLLGLALYLRDNLEGNLYLEWSNEAWNSLFPVYDWVFNQAGGVHYRNPAFHSIVAQRIKESFHVFDIVFGNDPRLRKVAMGFLSDSVYLDGVLSALELEYNKPLSEVLYGTGCSFFYRMPNAVRDTYDDLTTEDDILDDLLDAITNVMQPDLQEHAQIAADHGLEFLLYEGGCAIRPATNSAPYAGAINSAHQNPRVYDAQKLMLNYIEDLGASLGMFYAFAYIQEGSSGTWRQLRSLTEPVGQPYGSGSAPKWDAIIEWQQRR